LGAMDAALLQSWTTIAGTSVIASVPQSAHEYLDIGEHEDLAFYLDVRRLTGGVTINYETSPTAEDSGFLPIIRPFAISAMGLRVDNAFFAFAATPAARFVRWRLSNSGGVNWNVTFRIWVVAYAFA
jgi:hypothetical protein